MIFVWVLLGWLGGTVAFTAGWLACSWFSAGKEADKQFLE